jgi:transposase
MIWRPTDDRKASTEPEGTACARTRPVRCYGSRCDLLVGLDGFHVVSIEERNGRRRSWLRVEIVTAFSGGGLPLVRRPRHRRTVRLIDTPCFGRPVELLWRKRVWRCVEPGCEAGPATTPCPARSRAHQLRNSGVTRARNLVQDP